MNRISVIFKNPYEIELLQDSLPPPRKGEVLVQTHLSAISPGTEMLAYRGQFPPNLPVDKNIAALAARLQISAQIWLYQYRPGG